MKIFWSWQSDTPGKTGRHFIREVLDNVVSDLRVELEEPQREELHLDQDRKNVPGSPDLAATILQKIDQSAIFIADVTAVGVVNVSSQPSENNKRLINSNVAIELGYALHVLTDKFLLMVANTFYAPIEDLPFDLRHKAGPISFRLGPDASKEDIHLVRCELRSKFKEAIKLCVAHADTNRKPAIEKEFQPLHPDDGRSYFRGSSEPIGRRHEGFPFDGSSDDVYLRADGASAWLRVWPQQQQQELKILVSDILDAINNPYDLPLPGAEGGATEIVRAIDGAGRFYAEASNKNLAISLSFVFCTGEIWGVDKWFPQARKDRFFLREKQLGLCLDKYVALLPKTGIIGELIWECGLNGTNGLPLAAPAIPGYSYALDTLGICAGDLVKRGTVDPSLSGRINLRPFFEAVWDSCGLKRGEEVNQS